ncbi:MAG: SCO family protein [Proteobacteria bacterium]|nr:SCO family protein [Pseudomonadota bacterium]
MQLSSAWKDQNGSDFLWKDIKGQAFLVAMVYTRCERSCPLIISEVNGIVNGLPKPLQAKVQILLFTFDPQRDTLEKLKSYAIERKLNPNWKLLRGSEDDAQELAAVLGIRYKKLESGEFAHSNTVTVLDQKGQIYHQQAELFRGRNETIEVLKKLLQ